MNLMDWNRCEQEFVRNVEKDTERIASIKEQALLRLAMINTLLEKEGMVSFIENLRKGRKPRTSVRKFSIPKMCPSKVRAR